MIPFNIPLLMVVLFLLLTISVALYFTKKATTFREYAVGEKEFPTATLGATVLATAYGGQTIMQSISTIHKWGLYIIPLVLLSAFLFCFIMSRLALCMAPFMHHLSMSETIGCVYGKYPRIITALSHIFLSIVTIAIQIHVMSMAISMCVDSVNTHIISILAALILIGYSSIGGIRIITFTDVMQLGAFCIMLPLLYWWMFMQTGKSAAEIILFLESQEKFQLSNVFHFDMKLVVIISMLLSGIITGLEPPIIQRIYMSADHFQASRVFWNAGLGSLFIMSFMLLIGLFTFVSEPELPQEEVWSFIINSLPPIFKGFVVISLLALSMSTADSYLNSCAVMVSHDMVESLRNVKETPYIYQLRLAKLTALFIGIFALILSFYYSHLSKLLRLCFDCFIPIVTGPLILAILGFRGTERTALIGMATGIASILAWNKWIDPTINGAFPCMLANGLAMMAAHYLLPQPEGTGWVRPDDK